MILEHPARRGFADPAFSPDGKTVAVRLRDYEAKTSAVKLLELATGKELAALSCPEKDRSFSMGAVAPDGSVVAVYVGGKKGVPLEVWFRDARTLEDRGKLTGEGDPERYGWSSGQFTPDGKRFVTLDGVGNALVWDVAGRRLERTLPLGDARSAWQLAVSPDGKTLAVGWAPKADEDLEDQTEPDP
jgi:WD40 repeat protein